jgi:Arc/MetJ-type ribon-helix-helix transcriptional regulator
MTIELKPEQQQLIEEALQSGGYHNSQDVIGQALEMLRQRDEWLIANCQAIERKIQTGLAELDRGAGIPEDELDVYLTRLKAQPE